jgi:hypothetical protein
MTELVKAAPAPIAVRSIDDDQNIRTALAVATAVEAGLRIASREDAEQAGDGLRIVRVALRSIEEWLREAFRPLKDVERMTRDKYAPTQARLKAASDRVAAEMARWEREEQARVRAEQERAQREAEAAARAAQEAAASGAFTDDEEAPSAAQVIIPKPEAAVRGAVATISWVRRVKAMEIVDPVAVATHWAHLLKLDSAAAVAEYGVLMRRGTHDYPPDGGAVVGGIRFVTERTAQSRGRA